LFSLEKRRLRGDLVTVFQYLKSDCKEDGNSFLQEVTWKRGAVMGTDYSWRDSDWTQEDSFSQSNQPLE